MLCVRNIFLEVFAKEKDTFCKKKKSYVQPIDNRKILIHVT